MRFFVIGREHRDPDAFDLFRQCLDIRLLCHRGPLFRKLNSGLTPVIRPVTVEIMAIEAQIRDAEFTTREAERSRQTRSRDSVSRDRE